VKLFGFTAEVTYFLEEELQPPTQQGKVFSTPPMFPWNLPEAETKLPSHGDRNVCIVYFNFPDHFIPFMAFYQMCCCLQCQKHQTK